jgi:hypothetical protein
LISSLVWLGELVLVAGPELLIHAEVKAGGVAFVEALSSDSGKVFSMNILRMKTMDVTGVTRNMLSLDFVSRTTDPCATLLDLKIIGDRFSCVHYWSDRDKIVFVKKFYYLKEPLFQY